MALVDINLDKNQSYKDLMKLVDKVKTMGCEPMPRRRRTRHRR